MGSARILAVDDERGTCEALAEMLSAWGHKVETAFDGHDALRKASEFRPDVVISDLAMPETDGLWLLRALKEELPDCPVVFLTGNGTISAAVEAIKEGAYDFIVKPLDTARLKVCIDRALEKKETMREVQGLRRRLKQLGSTEFIGQSGPMRRVERLWMARATISLPVPLSPEMATLALEGATRSMSSNTRRMGPDWPMNSVEPSCLRRRRSPCTSRMVSFFSSARSMQTFSRAVSSGLTMKS